MRKRISMLLTIGLIVILGVAMNHLTHAQALPVVLVVPATTIGDLTPAPGSLFSARVDVSNVPEIWAYELYLKVNPAALGKHVVPLVNMNFTYTNAWTTTVSGTTGTYSYGYNASNGNPSPGSGAPSYYHRVNSTASATGARAFTTVQTFTLGPNWPGLPIWAGISYAYEIKGNSIASGTGNSFRIELRNATSNALIKLLVSTAYFIATSPWSYQVVETAASSFSKPGSYKLQLVNTLTTAAAGANNYVQFNWDDIGLTIAPITVTEGPFLKGTSIIPLTNRNFTDTASTVWKTTYSGTAGTPSYGYDTGDGNPSPGSGAPSYYHRVNSTASATASLALTTEQNFTLPGTWPGASSAALWFACKVSGTSIGNVYGPNSPSSVPAGAWSNPTNAYTSDNTYASSLTAQQIQQYGGYGITGLPTGLAIVKVEVGFEAYTSGNSTLGISVSWDNGGSWSNELVYSLGKSDPNTVMWADLTSATSWTSAKLSNANFRVRVDNVNWPAYTGDKTVYLDWIPVRVTVSGAQLDIQVKKPDGSTLPLIPSTYFAGTSPWSYYKGVSITPTIFDKPGQYTLQLVSTLKTADVGATNYAQVNWDDIGLKLDATTGGSTDFMARYLNETTIYISNTLSGVPYSTAFPVGGSGTLANVVYLVNYGATSLDLASTLLVKLGPPPSYPPQSVDHTVQDGYFDNRIPGDLDTNRVVNVADLSVLASGYGKADPRADINRDNLVDVRDLRILGRNYGRSG